MNSKRSYNELIGNSLLREFDLILTILNRFRGLFNILPVND
jgi:hypothetical protein